ncbi:MAG TPA: apolipoprotein N-acyltransferase, partial [Chitinophagaceae bacterium]|nr:apolipoprotein N-acyltransferase [Chitinophagaceae bacterium]
EDYGYLALIVFWLSFEYVHLNWQLSWPWLTLGNVFALHPGWAQLYEYTGTSGGSLWILLTNILVFRLINKTTVNTGARRRQRLISLALCLVLPFFISVLVSPADAKIGTGTKNVVVVQPNIDPYEKFEAASQQGQLQILISLSESRMDSGTALVVWPETAINYVTGIDETRLKDNPFLQPVWAFLERHPNVSLLSGIESYQTYTADNKTPTARQIRGADQYYDTYNTAGLLTKNGIVQLYHKSKLVPGVETLPSFLKFLDTWFEQFGGTSGGYAPQAERTVLIDARNGYKIAPAICYESIYGEFLTSYIRNGANVIAIITNDGWWANTSGHKQHMQYARLRAIETRRWVVRSANTGISCFISPGGEIFDRRPWDIAASIRFQVPQQERQTFYVMYGDIISRSAIIISVIILILSPSLWLRNKFQQSKNG